MDMNFFETCLYGLISGLAEFFPVSADAHQLLVRLLFGVEGPFTYKITLQQD